MVDAIFSLSVVSLMVTTLALGQPMEWKQEGHSTMLAMEQHTRGTRHHTLTPDGATRWADDSSVYAKARPLSNVTPAQSHESDPVDSRESTPLRELRIIRELEQSVLAARRAGLKSIPVNERLPPRLQKDLELLGVRWLPPRGARLQWD
jgi:hypothetical protein